MKEKGRYITLTLLYLATSFIGTGLASSAYHAWQSGTHSPQMFGWLGYFLFSGAVSGFNVPGLAIIILKVSPAELTPKRMWILGGLTGAIAGLLLGVLLHQIVSFLLVGIVPGLVCSVIALWVCAPKQTKPLS